ncbi:MAG: alkaline phosphatase family protein [Candidatus Heimdallarchaeota archaeon]
MSRVKYAIGIGSLVLILISVYGVSYRVMMAAEESWTDYTQPYTPNLSPVPLRNGVTPLGNYVVIVVIDGARPDIVGEAETPNIDWIKENGTWFTNARCFTPSFSDPGDTSIGTGAKPSVAGVAFNNQELNGDIGIDNIFKIVKETGETTSFTGSKSWLNLYGDWFNNYKVIGEGTREMDSVVGDYAVELIEQYNPKLLMVHLDDTDMAGHEYGAASDEYQQQIEGTDAEIGKIIEAIDNLGNLKETLFIITSDHGMRDEGGHGGWEEEALHILLTMRGPYIKHLEINEETLQNQIAATVSFFLGYRLPSGLTGGILFDIFDVDEGRKAIYQISLVEIKYRQFTWFVEQFNLSRKYENDISRLEEGLSGSQQLFLQRQYGEALDVAEGIEDDSENLIKTVWEEKYSMELSSRLQIVFLIYVLVLVPSIFIIFFLRKRMNWRILLAAIPCLIGYLLGIWVSFFASGWYFSISLFSTREEIINSMLLFVSVGFSIGGITSGLTAKWILKEKYQWFKVILATLLGLVLVIIVNTIYISSYYVQWNYLLDWYFPEGRAWGDFFTYLFMLQLNIFLSILFFIPIGVAVVTSTIASKLSKTRAS